MNRRAVGNLVWPWLALAAGCYSSADADDATDVDDGGAVEDGDVEEAPDRTPDVPDDGGVEVGPEGDAPVDVEVEPEGGPDDAGIEDRTEREDVTRPDGDVGELCPPAPDPAVPELRLRSLAISAPEAMTNAILRELIRSSLEEELFIWLLRFTGTGTGSIVLRTGGGLRVAGTGCTYRFLSPAYPPDELALTETALDFVPAGTPIARLDVPMWAEGTAYPDPPLMIMPLRELTVDGTFSADHLFVGSYDAMVEEWTDGGTILAKITAEDANGVVIEDLGMTLCGLISGAAGAPGDPSDDCVGDSSTWPRPPDTTVGTEPAWAMSATFAASAVHITGD